MTFGLVGVLATLALVLALNWNRFKQMGSGQIIRMVLIWGVIIAALFLVLRFFGY